MRKNNFHIVSEAILLYHEQGNSLFADYFVSKKLGLPPEIIRSKIMDWFHATPETLIGYLEHQKIKRRIIATAKAITTDPAACCVRIQPMTEEEMIHGGENLSIHFHFADTVFGQVIIASTAKGICYLAFADQGNQTALSGLKSRFPHASFEQAQDHFQHLGLSVLHKTNRAGPAIQLHLKGTPFQIHIWEKLLKIPWGGLISYSALADELKDAHALGAAVGSNPVAWLVPCHRMVPASGELGQYHWSRARKAALICMEALRLGTTEEAGNEQSMD